MGGQSLGPDGSSRNDEGGAPEHTDSLPLRSHASRGFGSVLVVAVGAGVLAFVLPWISINSNVVAWSYTPAQNFFTAYVGLTNYLGVVWFSLLILLAVAAFMTRRPLVCGIGIAAMLPTMFSSLIR